MKELKNQINQIFDILKKIDINITNSASTSVDKIIDIINIAATSAVNTSIATTNDLSINIELNDTQAANIILENAASTALNVLNTAAIDASNLIKYTAANTASNTIFDNNMYNKCLIHEIRTPITNIMLGINSIENNIIEQQNNNELLNTIDGLYKSLEYIEDVLTKFCIIKNGIMVLNNFEPFSIKNLISDVENLLQYYINEHNIQLKCNINVNVNDMVYGDIVNIKHCIVNLIKNAIKYSNNNQNNNIIIININNFNEDNQYQSIIISVLDNNSSIPKHIKDKLFQPFNSTSGSGLGLYICKKILELHNGSIEHEYISNPEGNQFNIFIDLKICNNKSLQNNLDLKENNIIKYDYSKINENIKYNIIIVDDSEFTIKLMYKIFKKNNKINNILTAKDGLDAIQKICNNMNEIDIVFIDNQMPNLNGIQTVQLLRGINFDKIIIGITGSSFTELSDFNSCGIDYIFSKPLDKHKIELIMSFLNKDNIIRQSNKKIQLNNFQLEWV
jgi:signal transduction histidine kinase/CheY-like chemotaxis protein